MLFCTFMLEVHFVCIVSGAIAYSGSQYGPGTGPVHLDDIHCSGYEDTLANCSRNPFGELSRNCAGHSEDASVYCPSECC